MNNGTVLPAERPIFLRKRFPRYSIAGQLTNETVEKVYLLKRLPFSDENQGHFRHLVLVSVAMVTNNIKKKRHPITYGRFEVTQIIDCDVENDIVYYMATVPNRPGYRHLYRVKILFNVTKENNIIVSSSDRTCLTCYASNQPYDKRRRNRQRQHHNNDDDVNGDNIEDILTRDRSSRAAKVAEDMRDDGSGGGGKGADATTGGTGATDAVNNSSLLSSVKWFKTSEEATSCLYNNIQLSHRYSYFIQECLGPNVPKTFVIDTATNKRVLVLDDGAHLTTILDQIAQPIIKKFIVGIQNGFEAQVKLYLPPMLNEEEDIAYPLVLHT